MSAGHNILDHFPATLAKKVRTISKDKGLSAVNFIKEALSKACSNEEAQKEKFVQEILKKHEQTLADAATGKIQPFYSKKEFLDYLDNLGKEDGDAV